jgi:hypothetical protein
MAGTNDVSAQRMRSQTAAGRRGSQTKATSSCTVSVQNWPRGSADEPNHFGQPVRLLGRRADLHAAAGFAFVLPPRDR